MVHRSKWCFLIVIFFCWVGFTHAADPSKTTPQSSAPQEAPSLQVPETTFDFGEVYEGGEVEHEFILKNTGKGELQIDQVRPSCGCTLAHFDKTIPPGGTGKINLKVNLKGFQGDIKKRATVFSNDPQNPALILAIQGIVKTYIDVRPNTNITFRGMPDQVAECVVELVSNGQPFHIMKIETNLEGNIAYSIETVEEGKQYKVKIANKIRQGNYSGFVKCITDIPQKPDVLVRVSALIEGDISVKPQTILVGKLAAQQPERSGKIAVVSNRNKPFHITKLTYDETMISVTQHPLPNNEPGYSLEIVPKLENVPPGARRQISLTVETDVEPREKQEVQIHVFNSAEVSTQAGSPPAQPPAGTGQNKTQ